MCNACENLNVAEVAAPAVVAREYTVVKQNGERITFTTTLTMDSMKATLEQMAPTNQFAKSLLSKFGWLTSVQIAWGYKIATDYLDRQAAPVAVAADMSKVFALLDTAKANGLKAPKLRFILPSGKQLTVKIAAPTSRMPGSLLFVTGSWEAGNSVLHGSATVAGEFAASFRCSAEVRELVGKLAADPVAVIIENAKLNGRCCFCALPLSDERSVSAGYGQTCAGNWGLPWGAVNMTAATIANGEQGELF